MVVQTTHLVEICGSTWCYSEDVQTLVYGGCKTASGNDALKELSVGIFDLHTAITDLQTLREIVHADILEEDM